MRFFVYIENGFTCEESEIPFHSNLKEVAREWFIQQLLLGAVEFTIESE